MKFLTSNKVVGNTKFWVVTNQSSLLKRFVGLATDNNLLLLISHTMELFSKSTYWLAQITFTLKKCEIFWKIHFQVKL